MQEPIWLMIACGVAFCVAAAVQLYGSTHGTNEQRRKFNPWLSKERDYQIGPRGGRYYVNSNGRKVYK